MAACAESTDVSERLSFYGTVVRQLEELANYVRQQPQIDPMMAKRLQEFADEIREDVKSGVVLESVCRVLGRESSPV